LLVPSWLVGGILYLRPGITLAMPGKRSCAGGKGHSGRFTLYIPFFETSEQLTFRVLMPWRPFYRSTLPPEVPEPKRQISQSRGTLQYSGNKLQNRQLQQLYSRRDIAGNGIIFNFRSNLQFWNMEQSTDTHIPLQQAVTALNEWLFEQIQRHLKGTLMDMNSQSGIFASLLVDKGISGIILTDPRKSSRDNLRMKFKGMSAVKYVENINFEHPDFEQMYATIGGSIDTITALNILESGFSNDKVLEHSKFLLRKRGHLIAVVPSGTAMYPGSELSLDEIRKYEKRSTFSWLKNCRVLKATYFNLANQFNLSSFTTSALILFVIRKN
jgi:hypothetical protein